MKTTTSDKSRHVLLRVESGDVLPDALLDALRLHSVSGGWVRGSGVLADVELRGFRTDAGALGPSRTLKGPLHVLSLEGTVGLSGGSLSMGLRAVLARESDRGMETLAGEIVTARVVALEVLVTVFDDVVVGHALDAGAGVALLVLEDTTGPTRPKPAPIADRPKLQPPPPAERAAAPTEATPQPAWAEAIAVSSEVATNKPFRSGGPGSAMPPRPARPADMRQDDMILPEPGDAVDHFAFGQCEVVKSDGDRLHLKVQKDGRVKEIALEMLRVQPLESEGPTRRFRLERKM